MEYLYDLKEKLCKELEEYAQKSNMNAGDLEMVHKLTDTIKNVDKIMMLEEGGYSQAADMDSPSSYARGSSYANRGKHYVRGHCSRDGGYSREGRGGYSRDGYSRARGYSRSEAKDSMMEQLGAMMEDASNDREREAIRMCMEHLNQE